MAQDRRHKSSLAEGVPITITSYVNLLNFRHLRGRINSNLIIDWAACRFPTWGRRPPRWRLDAGLCAV